MTTIYVADGEARPVEIPDNEYQELQAAYTEANEAAYRFMVLMQKYCPATSDEVESIRDYQRDCADEDCAADNPETCLLVWDEREGTKSELEQNEEKAHG
jgi:hypothetical protein